MYKHKILKELTIFKFIAISGDEKAELCLKYVVQISVIIYTNRLLIKEMSFLTHFYQRLCKLANFTIFIKHNCL